MAVRIDTYVIDEIGVLNVGWVGLLNGDTGLPVTMTSKFWKMTVQAVGTFGAGGSIALEGSNDGTNYSALKDVANATVAMTDTSIIRVEGVPRFVRPKVTAGDGTTNITVNLHGVV